MTDLRVDEVKEWVKKSENICVLFHIDSDGITSAYLFDKVVKTLGKKVKMFYALSTAALGKQMYEKVREYDLVCLLDLSVDAKPFYVKELSKSSKVVIIDHHLLHENLNAPSLIHVSTKLLTEDYYPASYFVYNLFKEYVEKYDWVAAIGLIGDGGARFNKKFMKDVFKKYDLKEGEDETYLDTKLGYIDCLIGGARMYSGGRGALKALKVLMDSETIEELEDNSKILQSWFKKVDKELQNKIKIFRNNKKVVGDLFYYHFSKPKYNIGAPLSTIICKENKEKLVVLTIDVNPKITKVHAKSYNGDVNTFELLKKVITGLKLEAFGGHIPASGGSFDSSEIKKFEERLFEEAKDLKKYKSK